MKRTIAERIHAYLQEADGEWFRKNKWRFWWITVAGFAMVNAALTALVFRDGDALQNYMAAVLLAAGALVCWLSVCGLHYSDAPDRRLARGVAGLDSAALAIRHRSFLPVALGLRPPSRPARRRGEVSEGRVKSLA